MLWGEDLGTLGTMTDAPLDLLEFERTLLARGEIVVGIDEVGRGALAGPMTVGAVAICGDSAPPEGLNDSKLLSAAQRESLVEPLRQWAAAWSLGSVSAGEIDAWGLRLALAVAATRAIDRARPPRAALCYAKCRFFGVAVMERAADPLRANRIVWGAPCLR